MDNTTITQATHQDSMFVSEDTHQSVFTPDLSHAVYGFSSETVDRLTQTIGYKVGCTAIGDQRLEQWRTVPVYKDLVKLFMLSTVFYPDGSLDPVYSTDHNYHKALERAGFIRLVKTEGFDKQVERHGDLAGVSVEHFTHSEPYSPGKFKEVMMEIHQEIQESVNNPESDYTFYSAVDDKQTVGAQYPRCKDFPLRDYQKTIVDTAVESFRIRVGECFLLSAPTRSGKSHMGAKICEQVTRDSEHSITLVVSGMAPVESEWKETFESHVDFTDYVFHTVADFKRNNNLIRDERAAGAKHHVVFLTMQDLAGSNNGTGVKNAHKFLQDETINFVICDEAHFAALSDSSEVLGRPFQEEFLPVDAEGRGETSEKFMAEAAGAAQTLGALHPTVGTLFITATPFNALYSENPRFGDDNKIIITKEDIRREAQQWLVDNPNSPEWESPYYGLPKEHSFVIPLGTTAAEFFSLDKQKNFTHHAQVEELITGMFGAAPSRFSKEVFTDTVFREAGLGKGLMFVMDEKKAADNMETIITNAVGNISDDFEIMNISSAEGNSFTKMGNAAVKQHVSATEKIPVIITVDRLTTGSTLPRIDTVIMCRGVHSAQKLVQTAGRCATPYVKTMEVPTEDGTGDTTLVKVCAKPNCAVIFFDTDQVVEVVRTKVDFNADRSGNHVDGGEFNRMMDEHLDTQPVYILDEGATHMREMTTKDVLTSIIHNSAEGRGIHTMIDRQGINLGCILDDADLVSSLDGCALLAQKRGALAVELFEEGLDTPEDMVEGQCFVSGCTNAHTPKSHMCAEHHSQATKRLKAAQDDTIVKTPAERKRDEGIQRSIMEKVVGMVVLSMMYAVFHSRKLTTARQVWESAKDGSAESTRIVNNIDLNVDALGRLVENNVFSRRVDFAFDEIESLFEVEVGDSFDEFRRFMLVLNTVSALSPNEVLTPSAASGLMLDKLCDTQGGFPDWVSRGIIDNGCKSGVLLVEAYRRMLDSGYDPESLLGMLYCIPTSGLTYEILRQVYTMMGWDARNILYVPGVSCLEMNEYVADYAAGGVKWKGNDQVVGLFDEVLEGLPDCDAPAVSADTDHTPVEYLFDYCISNPPYQLDIEDTSAAQIYPLFIDNAEIFSGETIFITPARFLFNAGKTSKQWNKKKLHDPHFVVYEFIPNGREIFPNALIKGGVAITGWNKNNTEPIRFYIPIEEVRDILKKVQSKNMGSLSGVIYPQSKFNLGSLYEDHPEYKGIIGSQGREKRLTSNIFNLLDVFTEDPGQDSYEIIGLDDTGKRAIKHIPKDYVENDATLDKYTVIVPGSNGSGMLGETLSSPMIIKPGMGFTQTFIGIGSVDTMEEADAILKYVKTKFARLMLGTLKVTQSNKKNMWANVPVFDWSDNNTIDWSKTVEDIDNQLCDYFELSGEEKTFLEKTVKTML